MKSIRIIRKVSLILLVVISLFVLTNCSTPTDIPDTSAPDRDFLDKLVGNTEDTDEPYVEPDTEAVADVAEPDTTEKPEDTTKKAEDTTKKAEDTTKKAEDTTKKIEDTTKKADRNNQGTRRNNPKACRHHQGTQRNNPKACRHHQGTRYHKLRLDSNKRRHKISQKIKLFQYDRSSQRFLGRSHRPRLYSLQKVLQIKFSPLFLLAKRGFLC